MLRISVQDLDTGSPRELNVELLHNDKGYFTLSELIVGDDGVVSTDLITATAQLDREDPEILANGGLYNLQVKVSVDYLDAKVRTFTKIKILSQGVNEVYIEIYLIKIQRVGFLHV